MAQAVPDKGAGVEAGAARVVLGEEPEVLRRVRQFELLDGIRTMARRKRRALFTGQTATVVNAMCIRVCDCLGSYLQGMDEEQVMARHGETVRIMDTLLDLFADPSVLARWSYTPEQIVWFVDRLGPTVGAGRDPETQACGEAEIAMDRALIRRRAGDVGMEQAPFLVPLLCALLSPTYRLLPLARMLSRAALGYWGEGDTVFVVVPDAEARGALGPLWQVRSRQMSDLGRVTVVVRGASIQWVRIEGAWPKMERPSRSNFLPPACRIAMLGLEAPYGHMLKVPDKDIAYLNQGLAAWTARIGTGAKELMAVLEGTYCISRTGQPFRPMFLKNHASLYQDDAMEKLWPSIAKCVWKGIFEFVERRDPIPRMIVACAAVEKATDPFKRLVTDYRPTNIYVDPWPVKYISIRSMSLLMRRCAMWWTRDLSGAYYNTVLGGCLRVAQVVNRWRLSASMRSYELFKSKRFGCGPGTGPGGCGGFCDKALGAICLEGAIFRIAAAQFGGRTSNGPLALLVDAFYQILRRLAQEIDGGAFVDDLFFFLVTLWHGECAGLAGGCTECGKAAEKGAKFVELVDALLAELHLELSDKDGLLGQVGVFLGVMIDTHRGRLNLTPLKYEKLMADLRAVLTWDEATPRMASKVRGKLQSYSECIEGVKVFGVPFTVFIGPARTVSDWDVQSRAVAGMQETARYLLGYLPRAVPAGAPLWKLEACTMAELSDRGVEMGCKVFIMTCDAAVPGVGMAYRLGNGEIRACRGRRYDKLSTVMTYALDRAAAGGTREQVWREGWGMVMAFEVMLLDEEVHDCIVIIRNDCAPALAALEKGSSGSPQLQAAAVALHKLSNAKGVRLMFLHVSGQQLVAEGIDDGSRKHAAALRGPACGHELQETVRQFATAAGGAITIDFFASAANTVAARFASWTEEAGAELTDAFSSRSWDQGQCVCGKYHRETGFYFPPNGLEERVVRRAKSDGARGIFLVPINQKAAYYKCLRQFAVIEQAVGAKVGLFTHTARQMPKHVLIAADFATGNADRASPPCGQEFVRRVNGRAIRQIEQAEQAGISECIAALAESVLAGRAGAQRLE